jgi:hypothetical protein
MLSCIFRDDEVIVALNGVPYTVSVEDDRWDDVVDAIERKDENELTSLLSVKQKYEHVQREFSSQGISYGETSYTFFDTPVPMDVSMYLSDAIQRGSAQPVINFIKNLFDNPNHDTRHNLFEFMDKNKLPITDDGCFMAYKVVRSDYMDKHSNSMSNAVGEKLEVSWGQVDTDPSITCSRGLHVCSYSYSTTFYSPGDRIIAVKVNPADVGAIPYDYDSAKVRTRGYEVVADITDQWLREAEKTKIHIDNGLDPYRQSSSSQYVRDYF